jgi:hypothetical protein
MADDNTEENPHPEDENIEADLVVSEAQAAPVPEGNLAEEDADDVAGNGFPEVEADQASHENNPGESHGGNLDMETAGASGEDIDLNAGGNGVPEVEADQADQVSSEGDPRENNGGPSLEEAAVAAGNGYPEVEADQISPSKSSEENVNAASTNSSSIAAQDPDLKEYKTEDDQASPGDNPGLAESMAASEDTDPDLRTEDDQGAVGGNATDNLGQSAEFNSEENLESDFPAEADLDSGVPLDGNCDTSSTESRVKIEEDLDAVDEEMGSGCDAEADSGDGLGHVVLDIAAEGVGSSDGQADILHQIQDAVCSDTGDNIVGAPQPSGSGNDVSFEPECDQGPSDNSAHSSQIFCDDDSELDEVRQEGGEFKGLESDIEEGLVKNDTDQPEDMIGACGGCDIDSGPENETNFGVSGACDIIDEGGKLDSPFDLRREGATPVDLAGESNESCPEQVPDITTSRLECVETESSQNISISAENVCYGNNHDVISDSGKSSLEIETDNTESCSALNSQSETIGGSSDDLGFDQADVGIEHRRGSLDQNPVPQTSELVTTGGQQENSEKPVNNESGPVDTTSGHASPVDTGCQPLKSENITPIDLKSKETFEGDDQLLSELDAMLEDESNATGDARQELPNGLHPEMSAKDLLEFKELKAEYDTIAKKVHEQEEQIKRYFKIVAYREFE